MAKKAANENTQSISISKETTAELLQFFNKPTKFKELHPSIIARYENKLALDCQLAGHPDFISKSLDCYDRGYLNTTIELKEFKQIQLAISAYLQSLKNNESLENKKIILDSLKKLQKPLDRILNALENRSQNLLDYIKIIDPFKKKNPAAKYLHQKLSKQRGFVNESILLVSTYYKNSLEVSAEILKFLASTKTKELSF